MGAERSEDASGVRLSDLLCGLTLVMDLGMARRPGESLFSCLVTTGFARALNLDPTTVADAYHASLLRHVGCTAFAHETALLLGDDVRVNEAGSRTDFSDVRDVFATFLPGVTAGAAPMRRLRLTAATFLNGPVIDRDGHRANCEVAAQMADRLGLGAGVGGALTQMFEWWNGKGGPRGLAGDDIRLATRLTHVASTAALFHGIGGTAMALAMLERRSGTLLDPALVADFHRHGPDLLGEAADADPTRAVLDAEPRPVRRLTPDGVDEAARAFGDMVDLKSPYLHGHSAGVAESAHRAGVRLGLPEASDGRLRTAGWTHDLGRVAVSSGVWDRPGALDEGEWEQVRLHAYYSERILRRCPPLAAVARLAGSHHERCDGTGYHRGLESGEIPMAVCVLAAADELTALRAARPHRAALDLDEAARVLRAHAREGALEAEAAEAVLGAAGHDGARGGRRVWPAGLTDRQVQVLRLLCEGLTNRQIAGRLDVSPRTAEHHVQDVYAKIGVSSRAAAAMFAMRHAVLSSTP
ncbi:LuxR C-terminal-related transcriptional regulator [Nocardiopsis sp. N85]|uniref:HD domain-containing phosphohydrolase n=1 Tax=Nocardiopsis sp. N85 TaxID=3029400 RepID=UPI00237F6BA5|nr:HD domain-containing phosphohydrolase [Nocardiopsis sp. N85]MDE3721228.1 LuxR C-terminal-related transcriptional regulator [Nocardiopsis sp. N85]